MPTISHYKPEINRGQTLQSTNQINIQNLFSIANRHEQLIDKLKSFGTDKNIYLDGIWKMNFEYLSD